MRYNVIILEFIRYNGKKMTTETRNLLARQLKEARHKRGWTLNDVAKRTGRQNARISEMESGRFNSTVDSLSEAGAALGLSLVFVPAEKVDVALALAGEVKQREGVTRNVGSAFDDVFIDDRDIEDEGGNADADS